MNGFKIIAHCQVKNEEVWVWYSLMSVLDCVDQILVWDTGSTDSTINQIQQINNPKIKFKRAGETPDEVRLAKVRQQMIEASTGFDWMMILDGDEVWLDQSIKNISRIIKIEGSKYESIVTPTLNCLGDIFHVSPPDSGKYRLLGKTGHYNIRFINLRLPGLHVDSPHGKLLTYLDNQGTQIQNRDWAKILYADFPFLHMTHLTRSLQRQNETNVFWRSAKKKCELGLSLAADFSYPKAFYLPRRRLIKNPFEKRSLNFFLNALWQTPLRKIKRKLLP